MRTKFWFCLFLILLFLCLLGAYRARPAISGGDLGELSEAVTAALLRSEEARAVFGMTEENGFLL